MSEYAERPHVEEDGEDLLTMGGLRSEPTEEDLEADELEMFAASLKSKKKKKKKKSDKKKKKKLDIDVTLKENVTAFDVAADDDREYAYQELLDRIFALLRKKNPSLGNRKDKALSVPVLRPVGSRKTMWENFPQNCKQIGRPIEHVMKYFLTEMNSTGQLDGSNRLIFRDRFREKQIRPLLSRYIMEYVTCGSCHSPETELTRDPVKRMYFLTCNLCGCRRSVASIKQGFVAARRGERRAARMAGTS
ncbi:MAG: hypothetical protein MHM6MM_004011 [Cercozoa sp. M6MM]